jgi:hypothetical protein
MFTAEFEPAEMDGRRRSPRAPVSFDADIGLGGMGRAICRVVDISRHGARLSTYSQLKRGTTIWLKLPALAPIAADVMWSDDFTAGCQFHHPLDDVTFDRLAEI